ncbi:hypothetical protein T4B_2041 [Trichinella pseudospiralis]|uniref:Uncharacterized protein n=1 Tax=Trichinella pseudospiralis TaxID=6337 RepID=A0A0V1I9H4_TRIPS|nr:hypothetical protein T4B_2041 [Trichinella pseudospiralis]
MQTAASHNTDQVTHRQIKHIVDIKKQHSTYSNTHRDGVVKFSNVSFVRNIQSRNEKLYTAVAQFVCTSITIIYHWSVADSGIISITWLVDSRNVKSSRKISSEKIFGIMSHICKEISFKAHK